MGKIKKILENELVGGTQSSDVYPVTSVKAVYDESNERLDSILNRRGVVNISTNYNDDHIAEVLTLEQAIAKVPSSDRVLGFQGNILTADGWVTYKFIGTDITQWSNTQYWANVVDSSLLVQELGDSENAVMSQKAICDAVGLNGYPAFSASKAYAAGDIVNYNGLLYKFTVEHAAGVWNVEHVEETSFKKHLDGEVNELDNELFNRSNVNKCYINGNKLNIYKSSRIVSVTQSTFGFEKDNNYRLASFDNSYKSIYFSCQSGKTYIIKKESVDINLDLFRIGIVKSIESGITPEYMYIKSDVFNGDTIKLEAKKDGYILLHYSNINKTVQFTVFEAIFDKVEVVSKKDLDDDYLISPINYALGRFGFNPDDGSNNKIGKFSSSYKSVSFNCENGKKYLITKSNITDRNRLGYVLTPQSEWIVSGGAEYGMTDTYIDEIILNESDTDTKYLVLECKKDCTILYQYSNTDEDADISIYELYSDIDIRVLKDSFELFKGIAVDTENIEYRVDPVNSLLIQSSAGNPKLKSIGFQVVKGDLYKISKDTVSDRTIVAILRENPNNWEIGSTKIDELICSEKNTDTKNIIFSPSFSGYCLFYYQAIEETNPKITVENYNGNNITKHIKNRIVNNDSFKYVMNSISTQKRKWYVDNQGLLLFGTGFISDLFRCIKGCRYKIEKSVLSDRFVVSYIRYDTGWVEGNTKLKNLLYEENTDRLSYEFTAEDDGYILFTINSVETSSIKYKVWEQRLNLECEIKSKSGYNFNLIPTIDETWPGWDDVRYSYGMKKDVDPIPTYYPGIFMADMIVASPNGGRWHSTYPSFKHVFEGWNVDGTFRLTMLLGKFHKSMACIQTYSPAGLSESSRRFGWIKIGSDEDNFGVEFGRYWVNSHCFIILKNSNTDPTVVEDRDLNPLLADETIPNGTIYYNSETNKIRCKTPDGWKNIKFED